ncbi:MAG: HAD hydrolase-like protein [Candidatus Thorarchaeota archaeon]
MSGTSPSKIRAILFDLHHTITKTRVNFLGLTREAAEAAEIDFSKVTDEQLGEAVQKADKFLKEFQIKNGVDIHWGEEAEQWLEGNRLLIDNLGFEDISDDQLLRMESHWKITMATNWESIIEGAKDTLEELHRRGYILGICTRRPDNPEELLKEWNIHHLQSTIHYSAVPGYAKPSPFTLLKAAEDIGINPRLCAYVGNYVDADVGASQSAEMLPVLTVWSNPKEKELAPEGIIIIDKITELLEIFKGPPS